MNLKRHVCPECGVRFWTKTLPGGLDMHLSPDTDFPTKCSGGVSGVIKIMRPGESVTFVGYDIPNGKIWIKDDEDTS